MEGIEVGMCIYSRSGSKIKRFRKLSVLPSVRLSVCPSVSALQNFCTLKLEKGEEMCFFLFKRCIPGIEIPKISTRSHKDL